MSQSKSTLSRFFITILDSSLMNGAVRSFAELAHHAFALAKQYPASTSHYVPADVVLHRFAVVLYPTVEASSAECSPVKAILYQNRPTRVVTVDFRARTAVCEGQETHLPIEPKQIDRAQEGVKLHMQALWVRNRETRLKAQLERHVEVTDFLQHLESIGILPLDFKVFSILKRCPLCNILTARCKSCRAIMCLNSACAVSQLIPFRSCSQHILTAMCLPCLENEGSTPQLAQCPQCELWFCRFDLTWCPGRPQRFLDGWGDREHSSKPIRCSSCARGQDHCANTSCWSNLTNTHDTAVCNLCSPEGGLSCACQRSWVCDTCKTSPPNNVLMECPQCRKAYCPDECNYMGFCAMCDGVTLCDDCFEEDSGSSKVGTDVDVVLLKGRCYNEEECSERVCAECLEDARCENCGEISCQACSVSALMEDDSPARLCFYCSSES